MPVTAKWVVLGSSSGNPSKDRACSGHLLSIDGRLFMFDCGSGVTASFLRFGYDPGAIETVFISHMHSDHMSDLSLLIQLLYLLKREKELTVYLPDEAVALYRQYLDAVYLFPSKYPFPFSINPMAPEISPGKGLTVRARGNRHLRQDVNVRQIAEYGLNNRMESYSFDIALESGRRILYSADLDSIDDISEYLTDLDLLILETTHIDLKLLPDTLQKKNVKKTVLTHISDDSRSVIEDFAAHFRGETELLAAADGRALNLF